MRSKLTEPGTSIHFYVVEWEPSAPSWADFRGKVLGPTDPAEARADSLRGGILAKWKELGLEAEPDVGDNGAFAFGSKRSRHGPVVYQVKYDSVNDRFPATSVG